MRLFLSIVALMGLTLAANAQCASGYSQLTGVFACQQTGGTNVWNQTLGGAENGWQTINVRLLIGSADLLAATGTKAVVSIQFSGTASAANLDEAWIGEQQTSPTQPYNMDGNQVQLTFSGSASVNGITGARTLVSDPVTFSYSSAKNLIVSMHFSGTEADTVELNGLSHENEYWLVGASQAGISAPTGTWSITAGRADWVPTINIQ